jgi:hypothetical protein
MRNEQEGIVVVRRRRSIEDTLPDVAKVQVDFSTFLKPFKDRTAEELWGRLIEAFEMGLRKSTTYVGQDPSFSAAFVKAKLRDLYFKGLEKVLPALIANRDLWILGLEQAFILGQLAQPDPASNQPPVPFHVVQAQRDFPHATSASEYQNWVGIRYRVPEPTVGSRFIRAKILQIGKACVFCQTPMGIRRRKVARRRHAPRRRP